MLVNIYLLFALQMFHLLEWKRKSANTPVIVATHDVDESAKISADEALSLPPQSDVFVDGEKENTEKNVSESVAHTKPAEGYEIVKSESMDVDETKQSLGNIQYYVSRKNDRPT